MVPSRELAVQVGSIVEQVLRGTMYRSLTITGGCGTRRQIDLFRDTRPHLVVSTPARLADLVVAQRKISLSHVRALVLDEADCLASDVYLQEMQAVLGALQLLKQSRRDRQLNKTGSDLSSLIVFTSATAAPLGEALAALARTAAPDRQWSCLSLNSSLQIPAGISHGLLTCSSDKKFHMLSRVLQSASGVPCIIFVNQPSTCRRLCAALNEKFGSIATALHGQLVDEERKVLYCMALLQQVCVDDSMTCHMCSTPSCGSGAARRACWSRPSWPVEDWTYPPWAASSTTSCPQTHSTTCIGSTHLVDDAVIVIAFAYASCLRAGRCGRGGEPALNGLVVNFASPETKFVLQRFAKRLRVNMQACEVHDGKLMLKQGVK